MKGFKEYINRLAPIDDELLQELKSRFTKSSLANKELFASEGEFTRKVGFLESGIVRSFIRDESGKEYTKQFFIAPTIIGAYSSLLTKQPNRINQQALMECSVWIADYSNIEALYAKYHSMERIGRKIAEYYYMDKERSIVEMALLDADKRYQILKERFPDIESQIQQYHIASYLAITPTQLSRIRKKMLDS